jgi:hypothetical protein
LIDPTATVGDLAQAWLTARAERDLDQLGMLTASDAVWHSPVEGRRKGRAAVIEEVRRGFENAESFETMLIGLRWNPSAATARIRNIATRQGRELDSVQTLFLRINEGVVSEIQIQVDDQAAVDEFWS